MDVSFKTDENNRVEEITLYYEKIVFSFTAGNKQLHVMPWRNIPYDYSMTIKYNGQRWVICKNNANQILFFKSSKWRINFLVPIDIAQQAFNKIADRLEEDKYALDSQKYTELKTEFYV